MLPHIAARRLRHQRLAATGLRTAADVVSWFGAIQAQEYHAAKWAIGLRMAGSPTDDVVERAVDEGHILRTHVMRPTWHFVAAADLHWMLALTAPRVRMITSGYNRRLGLDDGILTRSIDVIVRALVERGSLTRRELGGELARTGLPLEGQRLAQVMMQAELDGVVCSGPRRGQQFTYALVAGRAPNATRLPRDEALATLTRRYFRSHAPATARDFAWWSGLTVADAKRGLEMISARRDDLDDVYWTCGIAPRGRARAARAYLLPIYDEYLVAYRDRTAVPHAAPALQTVDGGSVAFQHALVIEGQVAGTWRTRRASTGTRVDVFPARRLTKSERLALQEAGARYGAFIDGPVHVMVG